MTTLSLRADLGDLAAVREFVARIGGDLGLDADVIYDLQLAVDEACANVINHGYGGQAGRIDVTVEPAEEGVQVVVRDWGGAFDPHVVHTPDVQAPLEERRLGGLGLFLMRKVMDDVSFAFDAERGNTLRMVKRIQRRE
jgi:anti-sigma regulatory factor (Ser/Thr protein kinase)